MRTSFAKCNAFWNKCGRSVKVSEQVKDTLNVAPILPVKTRWNSTFDSIKFLLDHENSLDTVFKSAEVTTLTPVEKEFLKGYMCAMREIAWALDSLQGEKKMYFGNIIPTLKKTVGSLALHSSSGTPAASFIATALLRCLSARFAHIYELDETKARREILATITLPRFKLGPWVDNEKKERFKAMLIAEALSVCTEGPCTGKPLVRVECEDDGLSSFEFSAETALPESGNAELQCLQYLQDEDKSLESLVKYPIIRALFRKFNTGLPSSAPAERLFSYGKLVLSPHRNRLSDRMFEILVFLKLNKSVEF